MRAKIQTYNPETGYCSILIGNRTYDLDGIEQVIVDYLKWKKTPLSDGMGGLVYPGTINEAKYLALVEALEKALQDAKTPPIFTA